MMSRSNRKNSSIIEMLSDQSSSSSEELNTLKEFFEMLNERTSKAISSNEDENDDGTLDNKKKLTFDYITENLKQALECALIQKTSQAAMTLQNRKILISFKIIEWFGSHGSDHIENYDNIQTYVASLLDKSFFEKLMKLFESNCQENALNLVKNLIKILQKALHHNLSIINSILQIIELALKNNNQIKSLGYDCWAYLINNFALDRDFFFKPKKFNLILIPLVNKCKNYKDEVLCKSKVLAWLCLIENVAERLPEYTNKVLIPFFNYCFGLNNSIDLEKKDENFENIQWIKIVPEHHFNVLIQIGFELIVSILFDGNLALMDEDHRKNLTYINKEKKYNIDQTINDHKLWIYILNTLFHVCLKNSDIRSTNFYLIMESWKKVCQLLKINYWSNQKDEEAEEGFSNSQILNQEQNDELNRINNNKIVELFLICTIEFVNGFNLNVSSAKSSTFYNKNFNELIKYTLVALKHAYRKFFSNNEKIHHEIIELIKKASQLFATEEEDSGAYLENIGYLLDLIESHSSLNEIFYWLDISNRLYEHFRSIKGKNSQILLNKRSYDTIHLALIFPFKHFKKLVINWSDMKHISNNCTNIAKIFTALLKQNKVKIDEENSSLNQRNVYLSVISQDCQNVNQWCSRVFVNLKIKFESSPSCIDFSTNLCSSVAANAAAQHASLAFIEDTIKNLQMLTNFVLYIMHNLWDFDLVNQSESIQNESTSLDQLNKKKNSSSAVFSSLIDLVQRLIKLFYEFTIKAQKHSSNDTIQQSATNSSSQENSNTETSKQSNENRQPIIIFCNLVEILSILFTRIKSNQIYSEFLIGLASSVEYITELHSISKQTTSDSASINQITSPANPVKNHTRRQSTSSLRLCSAVLQSTRRSNDLYDTFSMQIASHIQNNLSKTYHQFQFDSDLLTKMEPIFYSFLFFPTKPNLKQKTLQAWNSTFGKSTSSSLNYSKRLEKLFIELREEMISNYKSGKSSISSGATPKSNNIGAFMAISLPGFKPIDSLLLQSTNSTFQNENMDDYGLNFDEKENTPENLKSSASFTQEKVEGSMKEIFNESSSSVPMIQLVTHKKSEEPPTIAQVNFVFSPATRNSFANTINGSASTSKLHSFKTPETVDKTNKASPRSLKHNSKRKLDLGGLIDQQPDKDFVQITKSSNCNLMKKLNKINDNENASTEENKAFKFKQPLTEHQKEVRKQKSFIPMEIQSVCSEIVDSQMSCSMTQDDFDDTNQSLMNPSFSVNPINKNYLDKIVNKSMPSMENDENANDKMDVSVEIASEPHPNEEIKTTEESNSAKIGAVSLTKRFQSKINPKKQIELVEVDNQSIRRSVRLKSRETKSANEENEEANDAISLSQAEEPVLNELPNTDSAEPNVQNPTEIESPTQTSEIIETDDTKIEVSNEKSKYSRILKRLKLRNKLHKVNSSNKSSSNYLDRLKKIKPCLSSTSTKIKRISDTKTNKTSSKISKAKANRNYNKLIKKLNKIKYKNLIIENFKNEDKFNNNNNDVLYKYTDKSEKSSNPIQDVSMTNINEEKQQQKNEVEPKSINQIEQKVKDTDKIIQVDDDEDDDVPLNKLLFDQNKSQIENKPESQKETEKVASNIIDLVEDKDSLGDVKPENKVLEEVSKNLISSSPCTPRPFPEKPNRQDLGTTISESTNNLIQKLNNTPTTSILKKRPQNSVTYSAGKPINERKDLNLAGSPNISLNLMNSLNNNQNLTPNTKRRVSFNTEIQIEEIEPDANKANPQVNRYRQQNNRTKIISSYRSSISSPIITSSQNSYNSITSNSLLQTSNQASASTITTIVSNNTEIVGSPSLNIQSTVNKINNNTNSNTFGSPFSQAKSTSSRLSESINLMSSINSTNPLTSQVTGSMSVPNSPNSLFTDILNNKSSFLGQRSSKILQQKMQIQQQQAKSVPVVNKVIAALSNGSENSGSDSEVPTQRDSPLKTSKTIEETSRPEPENKNEIFDYIQHFKDSKDNLEDLFNIVDLTLYFTRASFTRVFKQKNIITIGDLCSQSEEQINSLPFKVPKFQSFQALIQKYSERVANNNQATGSAKSSLGSVEEEMAKLEANNLLDTSIECESISENNEKSLEKSREKKQKTSPVKVVADDKVNVKSENDQNVMDIDSEHKDQTNDLLKKLIIIETEIKNKKLSPNKLVENIEKVSELSNSGSVFELEDLFKLQQNIKDLRSKAKIQYNELLESLESSDAKVNDLMKEKFFKGSK